ncbi:MAG: hypothetical protein A2X55_03190 [Nitrospirae bacterium GWB2_47_37]|nr:MAG: hypothetical protein A2X55_03190 [Nitrospirae bacterium GWB2_47_37]HAK87599.1 hypothetical protein [Nitrospiraceae bacterium]
MKNIVLIGNPIAGGGALKKIKKAVSLLEGMGCNVNLMLTARKGDAEAFAREIGSNPLARNSELLVIAAGGDGTYNETANGLVYSDIPMAILPLGTTSVLAKELKMPGGLENALDIALNGKIQTIHLGKITCTRNSSPVSRHFILMAGIGFDGDTVYGVNEKIKKLSGKGAYILSGIKTLLNYRPEPITITHSPLVSPITGYSAIIGKASCYGGEFKVTPDATIFEPYFHVFVTRNRGRANLLKHIAGIAAGKHQSSPDISYFKASEIEIKGNAHIQIDGDYLGMTPAKIEIERDALKLATRY